MKIINHTYFVTRDLKKILTRCANEHLLESKKKHARITIMYRGVRGRTANGCATVGGWHATIRMSSDKPDSRSFAWVAIHEFRHLNGWTHKEMPATYDDNTLKQMAWADAYPIGIKAPKVKTRPGPDLKLAHARAQYKKAQTRLKRAQTLEKKWRMKVRYYEKKALPVPETIAAGGPQ